VDAAGGVVNDEVAVEKAVELRNSLMALAQSAHDLKTYTDKYKDWIPNTSWLSKVKKRRSLAM
jgi:hypothetical protein